MADRRRNRCSKSVAKGGAEPAVSGCIREAGHPGDCASVETADRATMRAAIDARMRRVVADIRSLPLSEQLRLAADLLDRGDQANATKTVRYTLSLLEKLEVSGG